ncbi:hypothetical protein ACFL1H_03690 [Nanoarchaeota archaeon]
MKKLILAIIIFSLLSITVMAEDQINAIYITGIGCPNCAVTDLYILTNLTDQYPNLLIFEYEIYHEKSNQEFAQLYFDSYIPGRQPGVPFLLFNKDQNAIGRIEVLNAESLITTQDLSQFPLANGVLVNYDELDLTFLPGRLNIWTKDRVIINQKGTTGENIKLLLSTDNIPETLKTIDHAVIDPISVPISGGEIKFKNTVKIGDTFLFWERGETDIDPTNPDDTPKNSNLIYFIIAAVILILILYFKPKKKKK